MMHANTVHRFWAHVQKSDECWLWNGQIVRSGYGHIWDSTTQKTQRAHRVSYEMNVAPIPAGMSVLHRCDNPPCVRPDHLFLGSQPENMQDMVNKGRAKSPKGEATYGSKLKQSDVATIRSLYATGGFTQRALAAKFGVSQPNIGYVVRGETWARE